jgi:hypothetical protein
MMHMTDFERSLANWLETQGPQDVPPRVVDDAFRRARLVGQHRHRAVALARRLPWATRAAGDGVPILRPARPALALAAMLVLLALLGAALLVGSQILRPGPVRPIPPSALGFRAAGTMAHARGYGHTATLLPDGRVLVIGGYEAPKGAVSAAELWDPQTETFVPAGDLATGRIFHAAELLADGRVLVTGGRDASGTEGLAAEVWDPVAAAFGPAVAADLAAPRMPLTVLTTGQVMARETGALEPRNDMATATLMADGRVLVAGGYALCTPDPGEIGCSPPLLMSAEIWDPDRGYFAPTGPLALPRREHVATLLKDGRVLIVGGTTGSGGAPILTAEVFGPR